MGEELVALSSISHILHYIINNFTNVVFISLCTKPSMVHTSDSEEVSKEKTQSKTS